MATVLCYVNKPINGDITNWRHGLTLWDILNIMVLVH